MIQKRWRSEWLLTGVTLASVASCGNAGDGGLWSAQGGSAGRAGASTGGASNAGQASTGGGSAQQGGVGGASRAGAGAGAGAGAARGGASGSTAGGSGASAGRASNAGQSGVGGMGAVCPGNCDEHANCAESGGVIACTCSSGFVGDGRSCRRPLSCNELHQEQPSLRSGAYVLQPAASNDEFESYCEMSAEGGGWTLAVNQGPNFMPTSPGVANALCLATNCANRAYSEVLLTSDVMLDVQDEPIVGDAFDTRVIITEVEAQARGLPLRTLFTTGPFPVEREDNTNVTIRFRGPVDCSDGLPTDFATVICLTCESGEACDAPVMVFGDDDSGCADSNAAPFAIGAAHSYSKAWTNCAGWPQIPNVADGTNDYPDYVRIWVR